MFYHTGESGHIQNIQINKVVGENEEYSFDFCGKKLNGLFVQPSIIVQLFARAPHLQTTCKHLTDDLVSSLVIVG